MQNKINMLKIKRPNIEITDTQATLSFCDSSAPGGCEGLVNNGAKSQPGFKSAERPRSKSITIRRRIESAQF